MLKPPGTDRSPVYLLILLALWLAGVPAVAATGENVLLQLKSGDRISGAVVSQDATHLVLSNRWSRELSVPLDEIALRHEVIPGITDRSPRTNTFAGLQTNRWKGEAQVGLGLFYGAKDRQDYYARFKLGYDQPYHSNPKKFFRN